MPNATKALQQYKVHTKQKPKHPKGRKSNHNNTNPQQAASKTAIAKQGQNQTTHNVIKQEKTNRKPNQTQIQKTGTINNDTNNNLKPTTPKIS